MKNLKGKILSGLKWSAVERLSSQGIAFVFSIFMARLLSPADFGITGLVAVFMSVAQVIINTGFASALIRKHDRTDEDFSTVFYYNAVAAVLLYVMLFFSAPLIASFYNIPLLTPVTRIVGLNIILSGLSSVHITRLIISFGFKAQAKVSVVAGVLSGIAGLVFAYKGYGVWAIVWQGFFYNFISMVCLWIIEKWRPKWLFSKKSFRELFAFGSQLMLSGILDTIFNNIYQIVIGKKFTPAAVGYFTRATTLVQLPSVNVTEIIQRVTFPALSAMQQDDDRLAQNYKRLLKMSALVIFLIMAFFFSLSEPFVRLVLTDKWLPSVPLIKILCFSLMLYPVHAINLNLLKVKGKPGFFLKLEVFKKIIIAATLIFTVPYGIKAICAGSIFTSVSSLFLNTYYTGKLINYGFLKQVSNILQVFLIALPVAVAAYLPTVLLPNNLLQLVGGLLSGIAVLFFMATVLKINELKEIKQTLYSIAS